MMYRPSSISTDRRLIQPTLVERQRELRAVVVTWYCFFVAQFSVDVNKVWLANATADAKKHRKWLGQ